MHKYNIIIFIGCKVSEKLGWESVISNIQAPCHICILDDIDNNMECRFSEKLCSTRDRIIYLQQYGKLHYTFLFHILLSYGLMLFIIQKNFLILLG
jgi:hypothetical protein